MNEREPNFSRIDRKKGRNRNNRILNVLIGVVIVLILIVGTALIINGKNNQAEKEDNEQLNTEQQAQTEEQNTEDEDREGDLATVDKNEGQQREDEQQRNDQTEQPSSQQEGTVTKLQPTESIVSETIIDSNWEPIGTTQTGNHVSLYDGKSDDWNEKKKALAYATGLDENSMIFWKIKNGGSPQKSIGIVSSYDKSEKYRVYIDWVDGQGWMPTKMDVLNTLDFDY